MTNTTFNRIARKEEFLRALPPDLLQFLCDQRDVAVGHWHKEPPARAVFQAAVASQLYSASTAAVDVLSALRSTVKRLNLVPGAVGPDLARQGWLWVRTLAPETPEGNHGEALEKILRALAAYAATLPAAPHDTLVKALITAAA